MTLPTLPAKILIATGSNAATTTLYRCIHLQEQFAQNGIQAEVVDWCDERRIPGGGLEAYDALVLHRVALTAPLRRLIEAAQARGKRVIFDTDDLIFEPYLTHWHRGVKRLPTAEQLLYADGVRRYLATIEASDAVLTATPILAELAQRRGKPAFVHRNALGNEMFALANRLLATDGKPLSPRANPQVVIGYGSGTPTHDVDFEQVAPALAGILATYRQVELWLVGPLLLPTELEAFSDRIKRHPLMDWRRWFEILAQFDINLAPLEQGNLFCRAKSEIKYVEAAAVAVPTIASRVDAFTYAIEEGKNGLLAGNLLEWQTALRSLIEQPALRQALGQAARQQIENHYSPTARSHDLATLLPTLFSCTDKETRACPELAEGRQGDKENPSSSPPLPLSPSPSLPVPLVLNWLVTEPFPGSGGHTGILRVIRYLAEFGHECHIYLIPMQKMFNDTIQQMQDFVEKHFGPIGARFHRWTGQVEEADATIATYWESAYLLDNLPNGGRRYYFIQDFEPYFYAMGDEYVRAENSYRLGLHGLTLGPWLADLMRRNYQAQADAYDFAIDSDIYWQRSNRRSPGAIRLCFYARPSTPRRAYQLGVEALDRVKAQHPDLEIYFFGANELPVQPNFLFINRGILNAYELAELFSSCDIGLVFSLTNPSFTPFEMMACGCAVVDIRSERVAALLQHGENAWLADPTPQSVSEAISSLIKDPSLRQQIAKRGHEQTHPLHWRNSARQIEAVLLAHAPPTEGRQHSLRQNQGEAATLRWQIHQLLDQQTNDQLLVHHLQVALKQTMQQNAELTQQAQLAAQVYRTLPAPLQEATRLGQKTVHVLRQQGVPAFTKEIVQYIRWQFKREEKRDKKRGLPSERG